MSDFYVGYLPKAAPKLARFVRRIVFAFGLLALAVALVLIIGQTPFANSVFEFGQLRNFEGTIETEPYPSLLVARPGETAPGEKYSQYLLVAQGKHGADDLVAGFDGKHVSLQGQLIYREGGTMIEIAPGSIKQLESGAADPVTMRDLGAVTITGEIVDSKCFMGVMNPGRGKVHRDCASLCLRGGIPPIFVSSNGERFLLVGPDGQSLRSDALRAFVAETIKVKGELLQRGDSRFLTINPQNLTHR